MPFLSIVIRFKERLWRRNFLGLGGYLNARMNSAAGPIQSPRVWIDQVNTANGPVREVKSEKLVS